MKNYKRALRRHKKNVKFKKRLKNWFAHYWNVETKEEELKLAKEGKAFTFLRTTGRPCNCWMCSGENKYKRKRKQYVLRDALKDIDNMAL